MTWTDMITESTRKTTRPTRPSYVPPPFRNTPFGYPTEAMHTGSFSGSAYGFARSSPSQPGSSRRGGGRSRGRGRGRSQRWSSHPANQNFNYQHQLVDVGENFDELEITEDGGSNNNTNENSVINFDAYEDIPVEITGSNIPPPVNTFTEIDLGQGLNENIMRCKYVKPTPVQKHAIPIAVAGRDLMACAQTGSGKTAAFCFPIISGVLRNRFHTAGSGRGRSRMAYPSALILSPTRELSCQIHEEAQKFAYNTGVKIVVAYGGAPIVQQFRNLEKGVDILVATPGRLVDMIERARVSLGMIKYLALDEADRMLDMGFEPQIRKIVQQMDMPPPGERQTMLFSATFPLEIQRLASDFLSNYIFLTVGRVGSSTDLIAQRVELVQDMDKRSLLMDLLRSQKANGIHGKERERALKSFKSGATPILVATDVASRGLDIPHVSHVINFDLPKDIDDYVHRIGRTGRAGKSGQATAFFCDKNIPLAKALVELMKEANQEVPSWLSQYAEHSSHGAGSRTKRYGGGRFGGYDLRGPYGGADTGLDSYAASSAYGNAVSASTGYPAATEDAGYSVAATGESYSTASHGYEFDNKSVSATGWD
ncbi:DEAD-box ATP-dependent RNA helicase 52B isoform X2 [Manihot esculenta]|uniref:Uncharacterized protein n=1 Tax=Manihot esculenta TaxID=3983 RepID=A0ACB7GG35_MANES|nr:DEAD-box ATP-dependent RNA helicase 52B isoform X2 [Manihot esculenta]KAG8639283.1 hypothetical protein MANES_14G131400v8 [Manihot esculenta]